MIRGIGLDVCEIARMEKRLEDERFLRRYFTEGEAAWVRSRGKSGAQTLAGLFAAKEALFKATGWKDCLSCSILNDGYGKPYIKDHPELSVSISHDGGMAIAVVQAP